MGGGTKEVEFYQALKSERNSQYTSLVFVDINYQMIKKAAGRAESGIRDFTFVHTDFDSLKLEHLIPNRDDKMGSPAIVFLLLGNTFANQSETALLSRLRDFGCNTYLLFDVPLLHSGTKDEEEGYNTNEQFEFTELTLRHFDKRYEKKWLLRKPDRISPRLIESAQISDVKDAVTLSMLAKSPTFGNLWLGMSHRYKLQQLMDFVALNDWDIEWTSDPNPRECWYALIKPKETSQTKASA